MNYYIPLKYIIPEEMFSPLVIEQHTLDGEIDNSIWRLMDWRIVWTVVEIRSFFNSPVYLNNYKWGGSRTHRGYRSVIELLDMTEYKAEVIDIVKNNNLLQLEQSPSIDLITPGFSTFTSQHCFGRAVDLTIKDYSAEEIRQDMRNNSNASRYQYITAVEDNVPWLHIDCRSWIGPRLFFID